MADHHNHQRPHHPLWGLVSTPGRALGTIAIVLGLVALVAPGALQFALGNLAVALSPFVGVIAFGLVVFIGFRVMFHRPNRRNGRH